MGDCSHCAGKHLSLHSALSMLAGGKMHNLLTLPLCERCVSVSGLNNMVAAVIWPLAQQGCGIPRRVLLPHTLGCHTLIALCALSCQAPPVVLHLQSVPFPCSYC